MEKYNVMEAIGEGYELSRTYGTVYQAVHKESGKLFAIKKFKESDEDEHVRKIAHREIRMLKLLRHQNIVNLHEVFRKNRQLFLVFEYVEKTILVDIERSPNRLSADYIKRIMYQLVSSIKYCHSFNVFPRQVIHRDIKPENLLVSNSFVLKLCDFGFARSLTNVQGNITDYVSTRWYRAPELLVGLPYGKPVDVWSIGCILAELHTGVPLFPGDSDLDTVHKIESTMGKDLPEQHKRCLRSTFKGRTESPYNKENLKVKMKGMSNSAFKFLKDCLEFNPEDRPTCEDLINHEYFDKEFKSSIELEIMQESVDRNYVKVSLSERNTPEPSFLKRVTRENTPKKVVMRSVNFNPITIIPENAFLPELKVKKEEDVARKIKKANHRHVRIPKLKVNNFQNDKQGLSTIYESIENSYRQQLSNRMRNNSRSKLKSKSPIERPYYHSYTPVPPASIKSTPLNASKIKM